MRSSKSRSRGNKNRSTRPSGGNIINRVFESSGPDGKVRGTPQQIIEKYNQLHRDAQLANDRVNAENFAQHAEHYTRMLAEAMREVDRAREEQEQIVRDRQSERDRERQARFRVQEDVPGDPAQSDQPDLGGDANPLDLAEVAYSGLVETPEEQARRTERNDRRDRQGQERQGDRPTSDRQTSDRQNGDRQNGDRQNGDRQNGDRQTSDRQDRRERQDRPQADRSGDRQPQADRQPQGDRTAAQSDRPAQGESRQSDSRQSDSRQSDPRPDRGPRPERRDRTPDRAPRPAEAEVAPELPAFLTMPTFVSDPAPAPAAPEIATQAAADAAPAPAAKVRRPRKPKEATGQPEAAE